MLVRRVGCLHSYLHPPVLQPVQIPKQPTVTKYGAFTNSGGDRRRRTAAPENEDAQQPQSRRRPGQMVENHHREGALAPISTTAIRVVESATGLRNIDFGDAASTMKGMCDLLQETHIWETRPWSATTR